MALVNSFLLGMVCVSWSCGVFAEKLDMFPKHVTISTPQGDVFGTRDKVNNIVYEEFLGIPYGTAERFEKPSLVTSFRSDPFNATAYGNKCPHMSGGQFVGDEDCLSLNIFTPRADQSSKKSVMVWIHGGSFKGGSTDIYPGTMLVTLHNVVVVTVNYRTNAFGFLTTGNSLLPGNYGLWDQHLALQWIKANIAYYGGNPNKITIFGESAGAVSISFHLVSPQSNQNLFHRAITQSGSAFSLRLLSIDSSPVFGGIAQLTNCLNIDPTVIKTCLKNLPAEILMTAARHFDYFPSVDGEFVSPLLLAEIAGFIQSNYLKPPAVGLGNFHKFDMFSGWNTLEGLFYMPQLQSVNKEMTGEEGLSNGVSAAVLNATLHLLTRGSFSEQGTQLLSLATHFYMNNPNPMASDSRSVEDRRVEAFEKILGDTVYKLPAITQLQIHSMVSRKKTYAYEYAHKRDGESILGYEGPDWLRTAASHADELAYVFGAPIAPVEICPPSLTSQCGNYKNSEKKLSRAMMKMWTNFAKFGNPHHRIQQFEFRGKQKYVELDVRKKMEGKSDFQTIKSFPRSAEHRFSSVLDFIVLSNHV